MADPFRDPYQGPEMAGLEGGSSSSSSSSGGSAFAERPNSPGASFIRSSFLRQASVVSANPNAEELNETPLFTFRRLFDLMDLWRQVPAEQLNPDLEKAPQAVRAGESPLSRSYTVSERSNSRTTHSPMASHTLSRSSSSGDGVVGRERKQIDRKNISIVGQEKGGILLIARTGYVRLKVSLLITLTLPLTLFLP